MSKSTLTATERQAVLKWLDLKITEYKSEISELLQDKKTKEAMYEKQAAGNQVKNGKWVKQDSELAYIGIQLVAINNKIGGKIELLEHLSLLKSDKNLKVGK